MWGLLSLFTFDLVGIDKAFSSINYSPFRSYGKGFQSWQPGVLAQEDSPSKDEVENKQNENQELGFRCSVDNIYIVIYFMLFFVYMWQM